MKAFLCLFLCAAAFEFAQAASCNSNPTMVAKMKDTTHGPLQVDTLSPSVRKAIGNLTGRYYSSLPRSQAEHYCKEYRAAKMPMKKVLQVDTGKNTGLKVVAPIAVNAPCSSAVVDHNKRIEVVVEGVMDSFKSAVICPANHPQQMCHAYTLVPQVPKNSETFGRALLQTCIPHGQGCALDFLCCDSGDTCGCDNGCVCQENCFPGSSSVLLESGVRKAVSEIEIGDRVQVVDTATGKLGFSDVYTFFDKKHSILAEYIKLTISSTAFTTYLEVSGNHFVYAAKGSAASTLSKAQLVHAKYVSVGDTMWLAGEQGSTAVAGTVTEVELVQNFGAFAPQTLAGPIVVDGVVAHSLADLPLSNGKFLADVTFLRPEVYSWSMLPLRWLYHAGLLNEKRSGVARSAMMVAGRAVMAAQHAVKRLF